MHIRVQINLRALKHFWLQSLRIVILWSKPFKTNNEDGYKNADLTLISNQCNVSTVLTGKFYQSKSQKNYVVFFIFKYVCYRINRFKNKSSPNSEFIKTHVEFLWAEWLGEWVKEAMISRMIGYREGGMVGIGAPACARSPHLYHPHKIGIKGRQARHNTAYKMVAVASWYEYPYPHPLSGQPSASKSGEASCTKSTHTCMAS